MAVRQEPTHVHSRTLCRRAVCPPAKLLKSGHLTAPLLGCPKASLRLAVPTGFYPGRTQEGCRFLLTLQRASIAAANTIETVSAMTTLSRMPGCGRNRIIPDEMVNMPEINGITRPKYLDEINAVLPETATKAVR